MDYHDSASPDAIFTGRLDQHGLVMHRLTQAVIRGYLPPDQVADARARAAALLATNHPGDQELPATWSGWARLLPHLLVLDPQASTAAPSGLTYDAVWYVFRRGDAAPASTWPAVCTSIASARSVSTTPAR